MEEKERYKLESHNGTFCKFHDTETDKWYIRKDLVTDLLNQQDKDIKKLRQENQQLKQQLHDLPKKIVEEIRDVAGDYWEECGNVPDLYTLTMEDFDEILDTILKKFGGKNE